MFLLTESPVRLLISMKKNIRKNVQFDFIFLLLFTFLFFFYFYCLILAFYNIPLIQIEFFFKKDSILGFVFFLYFTYRWFFFFFFIVIYLFSFYLFLIQKFYCFLLIGISFFFCYFFLFFEQIIQDINLMSIDLYLNSFDFFHELHESNHYLFNFCSDFQIKYSFFEKYFLSFGYYFSIICEDDSYFLVLKPSCYGRLYFFLPQDVCNDFRNIALFSSTLRETFEASALFVSKLVAQQDLLILQNSSSPFSDKLFVGFHFFLIASYFFFQVIKPFLGDLSFLSQYFFDTPEEAQQRLNEIFGVRASSYSSKIDYFSFVRHGLKVFYDYTGLDISFLKPSFTSFTFQICPYPVPNYNFPFKNNDVSFFITEELTQTLYLKHLKFQDCS